MESRKRNLSNSLVLAAAVEIAEKHGLEHLTIQELAAKLGVKPPSLYNHINGLDGMRRQMARFALEKLEAALQDTALGYAREEALRKIAHAYRNFARTRPELYKAFITCQIFEDADIEEVKQAVAHTFYQVLEPYILDYEETIHFSRCFRSALHGFVSLETAGFFIGDVDADKSFDSLVETCLMPLLQKAKA